LTISLMWFAPLRAQFAKPLRSRYQRSFNNSALSLGVSGGFAANDMVYTAVKTSQLKGYFGPTFGLTAEYNIMDRFSVGMGTSYVMRGTNEQTDSEFLTSFTSSTWARVKYGMRLNGIELRVPLTFYIGANDNWRPYVYLAPRVSLWLGGTVKWERTYDDDSYVSLVYDTPLTQAMVNPVDVGVVGGIGFRQLIMVRNLRLFLKFDVSYGISLMDTFSPQEIKAEASAHEGRDDGFDFYGWGDIGHETLGKRYLQNVEARLTIMVPLRKHLNDACAMKRNCEY